MGEMQVIQGTDHFKKNTFNELAIILSLDVKYL